MWDKRTFVLARKLRKRNARPFNAPLQLLVMAWTVAVGSDMDKDLRATYWALIIIIIMCGQR
jgi:hypothetical protein